MNEVWLCEAWGTEHPLSTGSSNISLEDFLYDNRGPKRVKLPVLIPITVIFSIIFLSGVIGNVATCIVIITNQSLHTATNYYLFSLAVSDLTLLLLGLPNDLSAFWQQYPWTMGEPVCKLRVLISEMTTYTSVLTIVAFTMERYLAICHPLLAYTMSGLSRVVRIVIVLWVLSFIGALPFALFSKVDYLTFPAESNNIVEESAFCGMLDKNIPDHTPIYELSFLIFFLLPMCIIGFLYTKIGLQIRSDSLDKGVGSVHGETKTSQSKKSIIRMLVAVVITFFLCWAPYHAQRLYYRYGLGTPYYYDINECLYYISGSFYYLSSTANPLLYNLMSAKYRDGFRRTFCGRKRYESVRSTSGAQSVYKTSISEAVPLQATLENDVKWDDKARRDLVVMITPDSRGATVTTQSHWPWTELRVTMDHSRRHNQPQTICVQMETCL